MYPNGDTRPNFGTRNPGLGQLAKLNNSHREIVRQKLSVVMDEWCDVIIEGVKAKKRTALLLWAKAMGVLGAEVEVNVNLATLHAYGLPAEEVGKIIEAHRASSAASLDACEQDGIDLLRWVCSQDESRRGPILAALGGSHALALEPHEGNGRGNGDVAGSG